MYPQKSFWIKKIINKPGNQNEQETGVLNILFSKTQILQGKESKYSNPKYQLKKEFPK